MKSWYGIKGVWSKLVKGTLPEIDGKPVPFEVWLSPSVPAWDYQPLDRDGPYRMIRADADGDAVYGYIESPHFIGLMTEFATQHMPRKGECCAILDRHPNIVLGWLHKEDGFQWLGCEYGFSILALHHPVSAAVWERQAHEERNIDLEEWLT